MVNPGDVILHLPVPNYVYKYCRALFGEKGKDFNYWRICLNYKEGKVFYSLLHRVPHRYEKYERNDILLPVLIPDKIRRTRGAYLTPHNLDIFCDYIKDVILDEIVAYHTGIRSRQGLKAIDKFTVNQYQADSKIKVLRLRGSEAQKFFWQKSIIHDILAKYNITEDEISSESIVKHLQRRSNYHYSA